MATDWNAFQHLLHALLRAMRECEALPYNPRIYRRMLAEHGPVGSIKHLLSTPAPSSGFVKLFVLGRLDLTVEAIALDVRHASLFTAAELAVARQRLLDHGLA